MRRVYMREVNRGPRSRLFASRRFLTPNDESPSRVESKIGAPLDEISTRRVSASARLVGLGGRFASLVAARAMSSYDKVRGGSLSFKNGGSLAVKKKKKKTKDKKASDAALELALEERKVGEGIGGAPGGDAKSDYEELFPAEKKRQADAKGRSNCWGTNYREAPDVLHGYTESWKGKKSMSAEERLDLRAASKADKFCR